METGRMKARCGEGVLRRAGRLPGTEPGRKPVGSQVHVGPGESLCSLGAQAHGPQQSHATVGS